MGPGPVFVIGSLGSGTSLLTWCLGQHPHLPPVAENGWLPQLTLDLWSAFVRANSADPYPELVTGGVASEPFLAPFACAVSTLLMDRIGRPGSPTTGNGQPEMLPGRPAVSGAALERQLQVRWVDGGFENSFNVPGLLKLFPQARFIHVLRDVQSVVRTLTADAPQERWARSFALTEELAYEHWMATVQSCIVAERAFGSGVVLRVRREDLVREPEAAIRRCLAFVGEEFSSDCLRPLRYESRAPQGVAGGAE